MNGGSEPEHRLKKASSLYVLNFAEDFCGVGSQDGGNCRDVEDGRKGKGETYQGVVERHG